MDRNTWVLISMLVAVGAAVFAGLGMLTILLAPEYIEFVMVMVFFIVVLCRSYWSSPRRTKSAASARAISRPSSFRVDT